MSRIKDVSAKTHKLKISISEPIVIYIPSSLYSRFWLYQTILSHNVWENEKLFAISELTFRLGG